MKEEDEKDMTANDKKDTDKEDGPLQQRNDGDGSMEYDTSNDYDTPSDYESDSDDPEQDIFFEQCLSTTKKEFISLTKWKAGQVGCFCREHCEARLRMCREGKKMDQEELWKLNKLNRKMNARKRCAPE